MKSSRKQQDARIEMTGAPHVLTDRERDLLRMMEEEIDRAEVAGSRAGWSYRVVRDRKLHRESHDRFRDYCWDRWRTSGTHVDRLIWLADLSDWMTDRGLEPPRYEKQARPLTRFRNQKTRRYDEPAILEVATTVSQRGGWQHCSSNDVIDIVKDFSSPKAMPPAETTSEVVPALKGGAIVPSSTKLEKRVLLRLLKASAAIADKIQSRGPHWVPSLLLAMTAEEADEARGYVLRIVRPIARLIDFWPETRGDQPEPGQQSFHSESAYPKPLTDGDDGSQGWPIAA